MNKKELTYERIKKHGENLNRIFDTGLDPIALCKKLRRLESRASEASVKYCNGDFSIDEKDAVHYVISNKVAKLLGHPLETQEGCKIACYPLFINSDPRGYALKIDDEYIREHNIDIYRDWGGYGILAPNFND